MNYCLFCLKFCCRGRVIVDCVSNLIAMATSVGRGRICVTSVNSPTSKTLCWTQRSPRYLVHKPSYRRFCLKFCCHSNGVGPGRSFLASFHGPTPKTLCWAQRSSRYLVYKPIYGRSILSQISLPWQPGSVLLKFLTSLDSLIPENPG